MNEELQQTLSVMLEKTVDVAQTSGEWAMDKAPELIHQFLMWELWSSVAGVVLGIIFLFIGIKIAVSFKKDLEKDISDRKYSQNNYSVEPTFIGTVTFIIGIVSLIGGLGLFFPNLYTIIHILVAPDIFLIKELLGK